MDPEVVKEIGQGHLLEAVRQGDAAVESSDGQTHHELEVKLLQQLAQLNGQYPGGLAAYVSNAKTLLESSRAGVNPFKGLTPSVPKGERLEAMTGQFEECETLGLENTSCTGFVLVAGGLGERLGYKGIKVALPLEVLTGKCFLQYYCESILALQARGPSGTELPLAIMTSEDTHEGTVELLHKYNNFGMVDGQITLLQQEKVPALKDNDARFALNPVTGLVETKPHGHGDVHALLHTSGTLKAWRDERKLKWIVFFQDTNALVFRALVAAIGVSAKHDLDVNSITVPRRPCEAVGAICCLESKQGNAPEQGEKTDDGNSKRSLTVNVEYNQLDPLLRATVSPKGDVADESGFSPYPGNINVLVFKLEPYLSVLMETNGAVPEFVNPKYADVEKTVFKKPTRLECMMQDYPKLLETRPGQKVGFTQLERFMCFSAVKNNAVDARAKLRETGFAESASSAESDVYDTNRRILAMAGVQVKTADFKCAAFLGLPFALGAKVVLAPSFGVTLKEIRDRFPSPNKVFVSERSSLVLEGDILVESLELDGDLRITAEPGARIVIRCLAVTNSGTTFKTLDPKDKSADPCLAIRGFVKIENESLVIHQAQPGETVIER